MRAIPICRLHFFVANVMRLVLFLVVNIAVALAVVVLSVLQDQSLGTITLRVIGALVAVQLLYVLWLLAMAWLNPAKTEEKTDEAQATKARPQSGDL